MCLPNLNPYFAPCFTGQVNCALNVSKPNHLVYFAIAFSKVECIV